MPDEIDTITVTGPQGDLALEKRDFNYHPQIQRFLDQHTRHAGNRHLYLYRHKRQPARFGHGHPVGLSGPYPSRTAAHVLPPQGKPSPLKPPHFSWQAVETDVPLYYRLEIKDMDDNYIFRTGYVKDMFSVRAPPNILKAGQIYRWRVRVADGEDWIALNNRSHNQWQQITVAQTLGEADYTYRVPVEIDDGWQTASLDEEGLDAEKIKALMQGILNGDDALKNIHSVLLVKDGRLVLEEYFYGTHRNHLHPIQSDTKSIVSILMGIAVEKGFIKNVKQPILDFFPEITPANLDADKQSHHHRAFADDDARAWSAGIPAAMDGAGSMK